MEKKKDKRIKKTQEMFFQEFNMSPESIVDFHRSLDKQYKEIVGDIEDIQYKIYLADKKKLKKQKKKMKKGKISFYEPKSKKVRMWAIDQLTGEAMFNAIRQILVDLKPVVIVISKLIMALIVSILSLDVVKKNITGKALDKLDTMYKLCSAIS